MFELISSNVSTIKMSNTPSYLPIGNLVAPTNTTFGGTATTPNGQFVVVSFVPIPPETTGHGLRVYEIINDSFIQKGSDIPSVGSFPIGYVDINDDGTRVFIAAHLNNFISAFYYNGTDWELHGSFFTGFNYAQINSFGCNSEGTFFYAAGYPGMVGAPGIVSFYYDSDNNGTWISIDEREFTGEINAIIGTVVAVTRDFRNLIGISRSFGTDARVYDWNGSNWNQVGQSLFPNTRWTDVGISSDGRSVVLFDVDDTIVYDNNTGDWEPRTGIENGSSSTYNLVLGDSKNLLLTAGLHSHENCGFYDWNGSFWNLSYDLLPQLLGYYVNTVGIPNLNTFEIRGPDGTNVASMSSNGVYSFIPVTIEANVVREERLTLIKRTPPSNSKINAIDDTVVLNVHPTNQTKLIADNSLLANDSYTAPQIQNTGIVTVDPSEASGFIGVDNKPELPPGFVDITTIGFEYRVTDYEGVQSNSANVLIVTTSFGPHDGDEIPVIPDIPVGQTTRMIPLNLIYDTVLRITNAVEQIGDNLMIRVYLNSDPQNPILSVSAADFFQQRAGNPLYGDISMTFNVAKTDTINVFYAYEDYSYEMSRNFNVTGGNTQVRNRRSYVLEPAPEVQITPAPANLATFISNNIVTITVVVAMFGFLGLLLLGII